MSGLADRMKKKEPAVTAPSMADAFPNKVTEKTTQLTARVPAELHRQIRLRSAETGISVQEMVRQAMMKYLQD